jgi:hypothetical protein
MKEFNQSMLKSWEAEFQAENKTVCAVECKKTFGKDYGMYCSHVAQFSTTTKPITPLTAAEYAALGGEE